MKNVMIDTETLGTAPDSVILSLAMLPFELQKEAPVFGDFQIFYPSMEEQHDMGRFVNPDTIAWWQTQPMEAREWLNVTENDSIYTIHTALSKLPDGVKLWARGTDFDFPLISNFISSYNLGLGVPWRYGNVRDVRTIADEFPPIRNRPDGLNFIKHKAEDDCRAQVWQLWERWPFP
jgi:hypothetical protein